MRSVTLRFFCAAAISSLLGGCLIAKQPLFDKSQSYQPFKSIVLKNQRGSNPSYIFRDGYYFSAVELSANTRNNPYLAYKISDDIFLLQRSPPKGSTLDVTYHLALAKREGKSVRVLSMCEALPPDVAQSAGVTISTDPIEEEDGPLCLFSSIEAATAVAKNPKSWDKAERYEIVSTN